MAQHDYDIANAAGAAFRGDLNNALLAAVSQNSGATAPATTYAYMPWADTTTGLLKIRNAANSNWITIGTLADAYLGLTPQADLQKQTYKGFTTGGAATAFTLTPTPAITANTAGIEFDVTFNAAAGATPTLAVSGLTALNLKYRDSTGAKQAITSTQVPSGWRSKVVCDGTDWVVREVPASGGSGINGLFRKADPTITGFSKTGAFTATTSTTIYVEVNGVLQTIASGAAITMPGSPVAGTDYAVWAKTDGTLEATSNHTTPPTANARRIGGFHYAPGGNATAQAGGDSTPAINQYSFWDLKFRPACPDPRGMALVADGFWSDIYLLGVDHLANGSSAYNVTIADGAAPPKRSTKFGGDGTAAYANGNWWNMHEALRHHGKRFPTYSEFAALAYGTTEASSGGTDPGSTILRASYTSKWGAMLAAGNMWVWGDEFGGGTAGSGWVANTDGRGSTYQLENAVRFGGAWDVAADAGSRCSVWHGAPTDSVVSIGARGVCDHLLLD